MFLWLEVVGGHALLSSTADSKRGGQRAQTIASERPEFKSKLCRLAE